MIQFDQDNKMIYLHTQNTSYVIKIDEYGYLLHYYYGSKIKQFNENLIVHVDHGFSGNPYDAFNDRTYSLDSLPQEFPFNGTGDYRQVAFNIKDKHNIYSCDLRYKAHKIYKNKYRLKNLPSMFDDQGETLEITLEDKNLNFEVILLYGLIYENDIITRSVKVINHGDDLTIENIQSATLDFLHGDYDVISFHGYHTMERNKYRQKIPHGTYEISSTRGSSSHQYNPSFIICDHHTTENQGSAFGLCFVYSGNFKATASKEQYGMYRITMGLNDQFFSYVLHKNEEFSSPEVMMTYSNKGLNALSTNLHRGMKDHLIRNPYKDEIKPVLLNSWEASYFDIDADKIYNLAKEAKKCDIDMIVMDDGWFGKRDDDNSGLGDWFVNEEKLGESLATLVEKIHRLDMKFGIWFEPECINEESELFKKHPDYALIIPGRKYIRSRNQLVLDFSRKEVVDAIFNQVSSILDDVSIDYIKWDFNRSIADLYSASTLPGHITYDYVLGLYDFLERLRIKYPHLLIEGCSGGGGRFDAGMLYYTPQIWLSDNTDAIDRLHIQYGSSYIYPICTFGSHVSAVPNHQTGRVTPMDTRALVAMSGTFGYEFDITKMSDDEKEEIKNQVHTYKKYQTIIYEGDYYRLSDPLQDEISAWSFVSEDKVLVFAIRNITHSAVAGHYIKLQGLKENQIYIDSDNNEYDSNLLMDCGLLFKHELGEYESYFCELRRK